MADTVLDIANRTTAVVGVERIVTLDDARDDHAVTLRALLDRSGRSFVRERNAFGNPWAAFRISHQLPTADGQDTYPLPDGFVSFVERTLFRTSSRFPLQGPVMDPRMWADLTIRRYATSISYWYRQIDVHGRRSIQLYPAPTSQETLSFEYVTSHWLREGEGSNATLPAVAADTNVPLIDSVLVELDLVWRFRNNRGLGYSMELAEFEAERARHLALDSGSKDISVGRGSRGQLPGPSVPEGSWSVER